MNTKPANLYSEHPAYETGFLDAGDGHRLHYARYGKPGGKPVVYLHGGPGAGCSYNEYRFFNPDHYDVLLFDQRGAGKSTPYASTQNNNIAALVDDLEKLRKHFGVKAWGVTGGSAGSALGMFYALAHPAQVTRLLLRGIFFGDGQGARDIIDGVGALEKSRNKWFEEYYNHIPAGERAGGLTMPYFRRVNSTDETEAIEAARLFMLWDTSLLTMRPQQQHLDKVNRSPREYLAIARIFLHFAVNDYMKHDYKPLLLDGMKKLPLAVDILHGRQDWICPVENALELHGVCSNSRLTIVEDCGHGMVEPGLQQGFTGITDRWMEEAGNEPSSK